MIYEIQPSAASKPENRFEFKLSGSKKTYSVPLLQFIPPQLALDFPNLDENDISSVMEFMGKFLHRISPKEDILALFEDQQQFMEWFGAWQDASTATLGESTASEDSSENTEAH
jgi:hypothetical protein